MRLWMLGKAEGPRGWLPALLLCALAALTCHQVILTAPPDATLTLFANPPFIPAHGEVSVISAILIEKAGTPVPDGTVVQFFTTLGSIQEQAKTNDGVARVNLVSDSRSGDATVSAFSGGAKATDIIVKVGSARPASIILTAYPQRLLETRKSLITANVFDDKGNPVANVPVFFTVAKEDGDPATTENMGSQGSPTFTDNNGQAQDLLHTHYDTALGQKSVVVTAETPIGSTTVKGTVTVIIN